MNDNQSQKKNDWKTLETLLGVNKLEMESSTSEEGSSKNVLLVKDKNSKKRQRRIRKRHKSLIDRKQSTELNR